MKTLLVLVAALLGATHAGCTTHPSSSYEVRHTSHLWQTDREATAELFRERSPEGSPEIPTADIMKVTDIFDARLELLSDGTYILHLLGSDQMIESQGTWRHFISESGTIVRLDPRSSSLGSDEARMYIRSWSIHIDGSAKRATIRSLGGSDIVLKRIH
jgi:hypothetical protein